MYNNYGYGYRPQGYMPYYTQPIQQQGEAPIQDIRFLSEQQIKDFIAMPNTKALLIDKENNVAYIVTADGYGNVSKEPYAFKKLDIKQTKPEYATKKDFEEIKSMLEKLQKQGNVGTKQEKTNNLSADTQK